MLNTMDEDSLITWEHLLMIDHAYHCDDTDYCGGLSFINRIIKKIGFRHPDWNADEIREYIESLHPDNKGDAYIEIIQDMLRLYEDIVYYGL
jgi:hypothetical protein